MYNHQINIPLCKQINRIRLNLIYFGSSIIDNEWTGRIVSPDCSRLYCVIRGTAYITMNGARTHLIPGKWYLLPAGCSFDFECVDEMDQISFHLKLCDISENDLLASCNDIVCFEAPSMDYEFLKHCSKSTNLIDGLKLRQIIYELLLGIIQKHNINIYRENYSPCVFSAINYIKQNLNMNLSITEIAEKAFVSKSTLTKHFRKELGVSVNEYITGRVLAEAEVMLITTNKTLLEISEKLGFSDQFYFSRRFKESFGIAPREYRKQML